MKKNNFIEEPLINYEELFNIDIKKTLFNVFYFFIKYRYLKYKVLTKSVLKVTTDYKFIFIKDNRICHYFPHSKEFDNIKEYEEISEKIVLATYIMNIKEKIVLQKLLHNDLEPQKLADDLNISVYDINKIYYSCMLKLALKLNIEIKKDNVIYIAKINDNFFDSVILNVCNYKSSF